MTSSHLSLNENLFQLLDNDEGQSLIVDALANFLFEQGYLMIEKPEDWQSYLNHDELIVSHFKNAGYDIRWSDITKTEFESFLDIKFCVHCLNTEISYKSPNEIEEEVRLYLSD